jgi:hypothetical protein
MLAMLERCLSDLGGTYAMCDTDFMAVVATERGGAVPRIGLEPQGDQQAIPKALSWAEVEAIRQRFAALNPFEPLSVPGSILEFEKENLDPRTRERRQLWCFATSCIVWQMGEKGGVLAGTEMLRGVERGGQL